MEPHTRHRVGARDLSPPDRGHLHRWHSMAQTQAHTCPGDYLKMISKGIQVSMATPWCKQVLVWHHCDITVTWHLPENHKLLLHLCESVVCGVCVCVCVYWREAGRLVDQDAVIFGQFNQSVRLSGKPDDDSAPLQILSHTWMTTPPARAHTQTKTHTCVKLNTCDTIKQHVDSNEWKC